MTEEEEEEEEEKRVLTDLLVQEADVLCCLERNGSDFIAI
jgi:hypothetical protein